MRPEGDLRVVESPARVVLCDTAIDDLVKIGTAMHQDDRKRIFADAKLAVRAYAKDPSDNNAARVHTAWKTVSDIETRSFWRQWQEARLTGSTDTKPTD